MADSTHTPELRTGKGAATGPAYKRVPVEVLRRVLRLEGNTGRLFWKIRTMQDAPSDRYMRAFNSTYAGQEAFTTDSGGYRIGTLFRRGGVKAHHVVFALVHGRWPEAIDHINGDKADNRPDNLRECDQAENCRNLAMRKDNPSGHTGVRFQPRRNRWTARIGNGGQSKHLGSFRCLTAALVARKAAETALNYHENHGRIAVTHR